MAEAQYAHNHTIDEETGFMESNAYIYAFDASKKVAFLSLLPKNGLSLYDTCDEMGLSHKTVLKHYNEDTVFQQAYDEMEKEYYDRLEGKSRRNALNNDRSVIERLAQLNAGSRKGLTRGKYTDEKSNGELKVTINIDGKLIEEAMKRSEVLDVDIQEGQIVKSVDSQ